jgi:hypothetical protein
MEPRSGNRDAAEKSGADGYKGRDQGDERIEHRTLVESDRAICRA